jgi:hypothetical protein
VENVQEGVDDCKMYEVDVGDLEKLYETCVQTRLTRSQNLLPPMEGFFFGGTDIDEYYWDTITETIRKLKPVVDTFKSLKEKRENNNKDYNDEERELLISEFYYHSSW